MNRHTWSINIYLLNFALLFTHEIDSAFWREWDLFGIPGDIQVFLVLNFALLLIALYGFWQVVRGARSAFAFSLLLAVAGVFAFCVHGYFILAGRPEFTRPVSLAILALTLIVSLAQAVFTFRELRHR